MEKYHPFRHRSVVQYQVQHLMVNKQPPVQHLMDAKAFRATPMIQFLAVYLKKLTAVIVLHVSVNLTILLKNTLLQHQSRKLMDLSRVMNVQLAVSMTTQIAITGNSIHANILNHLEDATAQVAVALEERARRTSLTTRMNLSVKIGVEKV
jgi:hypothetical protein